MADQFLNRTDLSELLCCSPQWARKVAAKGMLDQLPIDVRTIPSRGGRTGNAYIIRLTSLPQHLQNAYTTLRNPFEGHLKAPLLPDAGKQWEWRYEQIRPILKRPKNTPDRARAFEELCGKTVRNWKGEKVRLNLNTLRSWVNKYEAAGSLQVLAHKSRADKGKKRVIVSHSYDKNVPFDDATKAQISIERDTYMKGLLQGGASIAETQRLASRHLVNLTLGQGYDEPEIVRFCKVPRKPVEQLSHHHKVHLYKTNREGH